MVVMAIITMLLLRSSHSSMVKATDHPTSPSMILIQDTGGARSSQPTGWQAFIFENAVHDETGRPRS